MLEHGQVLCGVGVGLVDGSVGSDGNSTRIALERGFSGGEAVHLQGIEETYPTRQSVVKDLAIQGSYRGNDVHGIRVRSYDSYTTNVQVENMSGDGVRVEGYDVHWDTYETGGHRIISSNNGGSGLHLADSGTDTHWTHIICHENHTANIRFSGGVSAQLTNVHTYETPNHNIWFDGSGTRTKIMNLKCEHAHKHGIYVDGSSGIANLQIHSAGFNCNGKGQDNTYDHIHCSGPSSPWMCQFHDVMFGNSDNAANLARHAVYFDSSVRHCSVRDISCENGASRSARVKNDGGSSNKIDPVVGP
jgi:hypothetical protein